MLKSTTVSKKEQTTGITVISKRYLKHISFKMCVVFFRVNVTVIDIYRFRNTKVAAHRLLCKGIARN